MASLEDFLRYGSTTQVNATRSQPQKPAVMRQRDVLNQLYEKNLATGTVPKAEPGGWKGVFADVLGSPVGKAVMGAANVLDVGRRAVVSTLKEGIDAIDGNPDTKASWNELTQQINDPTFGFGDITGNMFGESGVGMFFNRLVGFAGDVALDPLTYVTLGAGKAASYGDDLARAVAKESGEMVFQQGAKTVAKARAGKRGLSVAGQEGRFALSRRLAKMGADDATVASAARYGRAGVKDADLLAKAGVDRAGLYFMGKRIYGTTRVGEALESGLSKSRVWFGDHMFSKPAKLFTPGDAEDARRALARGKTAPGEATEFMLFVISRNEERAVEAAAKREAQLIRNEILGAVAKEDIDVARGTAYKLMDYSDAASKATGATADERVASAARQFFDRLINNVKEKMLAIDPEAPIGEVEFYFPHFHTDQATRWMANSSNPDAVAARGYVYNAMENTGAYKTRMKEGDEFFGTTLTKQDIEGGADRLNRIAIDSKKIDFNFFETDLPTVLDRYIDSYAKQQGRIARKKYLIDEGVYKKLESRLGPDDELLKKASRVVNRRVKARDKALKDANDIAEKLIDEIDKGMRSVAWFNRSAIEEGVEVARGTMRGRVQLKNTIRRSASMLEDMMNKLMAHQKAYDELFVTPPAVVEMIQKEYNSLVDRASVLRKKLLNNEISMEQARLEMEELQKFVTDTTIREARLRENALNIQYYLDDVLEGRSGAELTKKQQDAIRSAIYGKVSVKGGKEARVSGRQAQPLDTELWDSITSDVLASKKGGAPGKMTKAKERLIAERYDAAGGQWGGAEAGAQGTSWWYNATRRSNISASKVEAMASEQNINNVINRTMGGEADLTEMRTAALAILATSENIPEELAEKLKAILVLADEADYNFAAQQKAIANDKGILVLEEVKSEWTRAQTKVSDAVRGYFQANMILSSGLGIDNLDPNDLFPVDLLRRMAAQHEGSPIARILGEFIPDDVMSIEELAGMTSRFGGDELDMIEGGGYGGFGVNESKNLEGAAGILRESGDIPTQNELTVGQFIDIMAKYMDEVESTVFDINIVGRRVGEEDTLRTVQVKMSDLLSQKNLDGRIVKEFQDISEVEDFISRFVTGKGARVTASGNEDLVERLARVPAIQKLKTLVDRFEYFRMQGTVDKPIPAQMELSQLPGVSPEWNAYLATSTGLESVDGALVRNPGGTLYASIGEDLKIVKAHIEERLDRMSGSRKSEEIQAELFKRAPNTELEDSVTDQLRQALRDVDEAITAIRNVQVPTNSKAKRVGIVRQADTSGVSIADEIEKVEAQLREKYSEIKMYGVGGSDVRAAVRDVGAGRGNRKGVQTAKKTRAEKLARDSVKGVKEDLAETLRVAWFFSEVETRFQRVADALFKVGLVPDKDMYRRVLNVVARDKGQILTRERALYRDAGIAMKDLLDSIGAASAWRGSEQELYDTIIRTINPSGIAGEPAEWASILARSGGRADSQRLYTKVIELGNNSGVTNRRRQIRSMLNRKSLSPEERVALKAELDALPSPEKVTAERKRFLKEELRPWYKANVNSTVENPSWDQIKSSLNDMRKLKHGGGRLAPDASAREMQLWVKDAAERLEEGARATIGKVAWMHDMADPYYVAKNFSEATIGGQKLPSSYAESLLKLANQYERAAAVFAKREAKATEATAKLTEALPAERVALEKKAALEAGVGDKAPSLKQISVDEAERKALEAARKVQRELVAIKNTDDWFASIERQQLDQLIRLFAGYTFIDDKLAFTAIPSRSENVRNLIANGRDIYIKVSSGDASSFQLVTDPTKLDNKTAYYMKVPSAGGKDTYTAVPRAKQKFLRWSDELSTKDSPGGQFILTREELESLFMDPKEFASRRASARAQYDNTIRGMDREIIQLESQIQEMQRNIRTYMYGGDPKLVEQWRKELSRLEANVQILRDSKASMSFSSYDREMLVRNSALEKMSGLLQRVKNGRYTMEQIENGLREMALDGASQESMGFAGRGLPVLHTASESKMSSRIKYLDDAWNGSEEKALIDKVRGLEASEQAQLFNAYMADTEKVLSTVGKLREEASKAWKHTPEDGAPYGKGNFEIAKYNAAIRAGKSPEEAKLAARSVRNISDGEVYDGSRKILEGRNVQEARAIASGIDEKLRSDLAGITRATNNQYDALARFTELIDGGATVTSAAKKIHDEVRSLIPAGEALARSATLEKSMAEVEIAINRIGFLKETMDISKQWFWSPKGYGGEYKALTRDAAEMKRLLGEAATESQSPLAASQREIAATEARRATTVPGYGTIQDIEATMLDAAKLLAQSDTHVEDARIWYKWTKPMLERRVERAERILTDIDVRREALATRPGGAAGTEASRAELMDWADRMITTLESMHEDVDLITALRADFLNAQTPLVLNEKLANLALRQLEDLKNLRWGAQAVEQYEEGLVKLTKAGLPSYYASKNIAEMSVNMQRMREPEFVRGLNRFIGRYTGYFKAGAVGTPGFVVRNTISNTFSLVSAGADPRNMYRGIGLFMDWKRAVKEGRELQWVNSLADVDREVVSTAIKAMDSSGFGRAEEALVGWAPKRKWLIDNKLYRKIRSANEASEQSARFILAYDSAVKGASFDEASAIVKRYLFDYVDVSSADRAIRSVVPFWFWMSRNLPLQIVNQWTHPRAYAMYNSFKRNFGNDTENQVVPSWLVESGAISIGGRTFLNPDLPMSRITQQVSELSDPKRLLRYVNPGIRAPFEVLLSDKRLYNDIPFRRDAQSPVGGPLSPAVQALASLLGQGKVNQFSGKTGVSDKANYLVMSLFPQLGQLERAVPATDLYKDRQLNSLRSLLGIPLVNVTDDMIQSELRRRRYDN